MVSITVEQHDEIFKHLMTNILKYKEDDNVFKVLVSNGIKDIEELMSDYMSTATDIVALKDVG